MKRIFHRWENWECYPSGFFEEHPPKDMTHQDCQQRYAEFLKDDTLFRSAAYRIIDEWENSCEHNLTNESMNRIAWIGQASVCITYGIPAKYRGGYHLLSDTEKIKADMIALDVINYWMFFHGYAGYSLKSVESKTEANLY